MGGVEEEEEEEEGGWMGVRTRVRDVGKKKRKRKTKKGTVEPRACGASCVEPFLEGNSSTCGKRAEDFRLILCPDRGAVPKGLRDLSPPSTAL